MSSLCEFYPGVCLTTEKKHGKNSIRVAEEENPSKHINKTPTHYKTYTHTHTHTLQTNLKPPQYKLKQTQYKIYTNEIVTI